MKTQIIYPKHPLLKKHIQYFLFIDKEGFDKVSQICYPNTNHCLSLIQRGKLVKQNNANYTILPSKTNSSYLTGIYKSPIKISTTIPYKELCINFNPFGIEAILNTKLSSFVFKNNPLNNCENTNWSNLYEIIFSNNSLQKIHSEIENFFLGNLREERGNLHKIKWNEIDSTTQINDLGDMIYKSYRSTHRFFTNELQLTPKEFLLIKKIRLGMNMILNNDSITEIAYNLDFTDQSHFIKTFKKYTNLTPLKFRNISSKVDNTLIWNLS